jgi:3-keto-5-aminohexanoate cleavage enzyme
VAKNEESAAPVIIEAAINGATPKERNPNVPISEEEITADALACLDAGAAIIHAHCHPVFGPDVEVAGRYVAAFDPVWDQRPDALLYPIVNFGAGGVSFGHLAPLAAKGRLRVGVLDPGSLNLGSRADDGRLTGSVVYQNSFDLIGEVLESHERLHLGPSLAIYEPGFLRTTIAWHKTGRLPAGTMVKLYLSTDQGNSMTGAPFGLPPTAAGLEAYLEMLEPTGLPWAVSCFGDLGPQRGRQAHAAPRRPPAPRAGVLRR